MTTTLDLSPLLQKKEVFENFLKHTISPLCEKSLIRDACEYSLMNGGKRFRPIIVLSLTDVLQDHLFLAATAVEYFHTASLIADDLPCMDNDSLRRDKPSLHIRFGETTALLASYALISEAYKKIHEAYLLLKNSGASLSASADAICIKALEIAATASGLKGATLGQYYDLFPIDQTKNHLMKIIELKTITLFQVAFSFGWIFSGHTLEKLEEINSLAYHFGLAFQIADDLNDLHQDNKETNTSNIAALIGKEASVSLFYEELETLYHIMYKLNINSKEVFLMIDLMKHYAVTSLVSA
ncbi:MAG: polyprenyl synthetase family protein [Chlamydiales bacterium]|nr:polyprenyl synthetase family protein [Chlamydiales bacterium]